MKNMLEVINKASEMQELYQVLNGPTVVGAWSLDVGTKEMKLKLALVYPDGEVSPVREYSKQKLYSGAKVLKDLTDFYGITAKAVEDIFKEVIKNQNELPLQTDGSGKCSLSQAYRALCGYVAEYEEPGKVFVRDGYGNILATYLEDVIKRLGLGYSRLELQKNFRAWGLLRTSDNAGHVYAVAIKMFGANNWYFSFKLPKDGEMAA